MTASNDPTLWSDGKIFWLLNYNVSFYSFMYDTHVAQPSINDNVARAKTLFEAYHTCMVRLSRDARPVLHVFIRARFAGTFIFDTK